jgi:DNA modification methylase
MLELNKIYCGDCLDVMKDIDDKSIDMILCDLPYGQTNCSWDSCIPLEPLWKEYKRITKPVSAIVLTSSQPFTTELNHSNIKRFKYELIWNKKNTSTPFHCNKKPLKTHENISVFSYGRIKYNVVFGFSPHNKSSHNKPTKIKEQQGLTTGISTSGYYYHVTAGPNKKYPTSVITISNQTRSNHNLKRVHPTQKPIALFEYLIELYSQPGDLVLDNCIGSGTTAIACKFIGRNFIGIEKEQQYIDIANERLKECL